MAGHPSDLESAQSLASQVGRVRPGKPPAEFYRDGLPGRTRPTFSSREWTSELLAQARDDSPSNKGFGSLDVAGAPCAGHSFTLTDGRALKFCRAGFSALVGLVLIAAGALILMRYDPSQYHFYPLCYFHATTGLLCPGCGGLRALHQLLHGNLAASLHCNALLIVALPTATWMATRFGLHRLRNGSTPFKIHRLWIWSGIIVSALFGIVRNLPCPAFAWLVP